MKKTTVPLLALLLGFAAAPSAFAGTASVTSVAGGEAKVGREGAWKPAMAGVSIGESDFLTIAAGTTVTVKLPNGKESVIEGRAIVPGRRLVSDKTDAGAMLKFARTVQRATEAVVGQEEKTSTGGAGKGNLTLSGAGVELTDAERKRLANNSRMKFAGIEEEERKSTESDFAEASFRRGDFFDARNRAQAIVDDPNDSALEKRRANLILGRVAAADASFATALATLDKAAAPATRPEGDDGKSYRAVALAQRGNVHLLLGNEERANADFLEAIATAPESAGAAQANFYLGTMAAERRDAKKAKAHFEKIPAKFEDLKKSSDEIVASFEREKS